MTDWTQRFTIDSSDVGNIAYRDEYVERLRGLLREARTVGAMQIPDWLARIDAALRSTDQPSAALTNEAALKAQDNDPAAIYLGPACEADSGSYGDGRTWAEDQPWDDCECGHKPVRYVRADIHDAIAARLAEAQEQAKADRLVVDEAYRNERIAKARLVDKNILLAQAVEYGNDYKRERDDLMVNYQATLARLAEITKDRDAYFADLLDKNSRLAEAEAALREICAVDKAAPGRKDCHIWADMLEIAVGYFPDRHWNWRIRKGS